MNRHLSFTLLLLVSLQTGCATLFTGMNDDITIKSNPAGAAVTIDDMDYGQTPVTFSMKRDAMRQSGKKVTVSKEGYEEKTFSLQKQFNVVSVCNLGNVLFWGIDFISGAVFVYEPTSYSVNLSPKAASINSPTFVPKVGDPFDLVLVNWGPANQSSEVDGFKKLLYNRLDGTYLITLSKENTLTQVQIIPR